MIQVHYYVIQKGTVQVRRAAGRAKSQAMRRKGVETEEFLRDRTSFGKIKK